MRRLGSLKLASLKPAHIDRASSAWHETGIGALTLLKIHRVLRKALNDAVKLRIIASNAADAVEKPKARRKEMRALSAEQAGLLIERASNTEWGALVATAIHTGMRLSELRGLRWTDVTLDSGGAKVSVMQTVLRLRTGQMLVKGPKTEASRRMIPISSALAEMLRNQRRVQIEAGLLSGRQLTPDSLVFADVEGKPFSESRFRLALRTMLRELGMPEIRIHDLRHTTATVLLSKNVHPRVVAERLGHSTVNLTLNTYSHVLPGMQDAAVRALDEALGGSLAT